LSGKKYEIFLEENGFVAGRRLEVAQTMRTSTAHPQFKREKR